MKKNIYRERERERERERDYRDIGNRGNCLFFALVSYIHMIYSAIGHSYVQIFSIQTSAKLHKPGIEIKESPVSS